MVSRHGVPDLIGTLYPLWEVVGMTVFMYQVTSPGEVWSYAPSDTASVTVITVEQTTLHLGDLGQGPFHCVPCTLWVRNLGRVWLAQSALHGNC